MRYSTHDDAGISRSLTTSAWWLSERNIGGMQSSQFPFQARALRPCIVFMDEIDAVGRVRGGARGNDERDQTLNQMLSEMDGFDAESGVIVMAATNRLVVAEVVCYNIHHHHHVLRQKTLRNECMTWHGIIKVNHKVCDADDLALITSQSLRLSHDRLDILDGALVRPGRFDRIIHIGRPDFNGRIEILQV